MPGDNNLIFNVCSQYRARQLFTRSNLNRLEIDPIPTTTVGGQPVSINDLNMRRKAEILQYNPNRQSNQTNSATKTQKFALLVNAPPRINNWNRVADTANQSDPNCSDDLTPVPTSSSDVPGPIMNLIYNRNVPLYNYLNPVQTRGYGSVTNVLPTSEFQFSYESNIFISDKSVAYASRDPTTLITAYFPDLTEQTENVPLTFTIPLGIYMRGIINSTYNSNITIGITNISLGIYLNDALIRTFSSYQNNCGNVIFNLNGFAQNTIFGLTKYLGNISLTNLIIDIQKSMIYTIKIKASISYNGPNSSIITLSDYGIIGNMKLDSEVVQNCTITSSPSLLNYKQTFITDKST
jgi:hypothetical protein